jgi:hypothetical protein
MRNLYTGAVAGLAGMLVLSALATAQKRPKRASEQRAKISLEILSSG